MKQNELKQNELKQDELKQDELKQDELYRSILSKRSFLSVGLDTDIDKLPTGQDVVSFNKAIIEATAPYCISYKINLAFYESLGAKGWDYLQKTLDFIPKAYFVIADAKRGDIGNTSAQYAKTFFETYDFDAITVSPYMGSDSVEPFLGFANKWLILLALTSNKGSSDFQMLRVGDKYMYEYVIEKSQSWASADSLMYVVGATQTEYLKSVRKLAPKHFLLVPGVGTQGGNLEDVVKYGINDKVGLIVNASRSILYASNGTDFAEQAEVEARKVQNEMAHLLDKYANSYSP